MKLFRRQTEQGELCRYKPKKASVIALALCVLWILFESLIFILAQPQTNAVNANGYCKTESADGTYLVTQKSTLTFNADSPKIENITFLAKASDKSQVTDVPLTLYVRGYDPSKSTSLLTYRTQKYTVGGENARETVIRVEIPEQAGEFSIEFGYDGYDYTVSALTFNAPSAVKFNFLRTAIVLLLVALGYLTVRLRLWHVFFNPENKKHGMAALALCLICVTLTLAFSSFANPNRASIAYPFESGVNHYTPYEQQFDAFEKGQLHIDYAPSEEFKNLENPYDPAEREGLYYLWDRAYYDGQYYSYFGIAPILTVYYPHYFLTGDLPSSDSVTAVFAFMTALFFSMAAVKFASLFTKKLPLPLLFLGVIAALFSTGLFLIMRGHTRFYYIATVAAMAFLSLFLWLLLCGLSGSFTLGHAKSEKKARTCRLCAYFLAGIAFGLLFLSRLNVALLAAFIVLPFLFFSVLTERREKNGRARYTLRPLKCVLSELAVLGIPVLAALSVQLALNYARFDSFFEFGTTYQLTVSDISQNRLRASDIPFAVFHYFLHPTSLSSDFPFVSLQAINLGNYGHYTYIDSGMGLLSNPFMWLLFASSAVFVSKKRALSLKVTLASLLVGIFTVALFDFCLGGVIYRYTCDLTLLAAFASMAIMWALYEDGTPSHSQEEAVDASVATAESKGKALVFSIFTLLTVLYCVSLALSLNVNLTPYDPNIYLTFRDLFVFF